MPKTKVFEGSVRLVPFFEKCGYIYVYMHGGDPSRFPEFRFSNRENVHGKVPVSEWALFSSHANSALIYNFKVLIGCSFSKLFRHHGSVSALGDCYTKTVTIQMLDYMGFYCNPTSRETILLKCVNYYVNSFGPTGGVIFEGSKLTTVRQGPCRAGGPCRVVTDRHVNFVNRDIRAYVPDEDRSERKAFFYISSLTFRREHTAAATELYGIFSDLVCGSKDFEWREAALKLAYHSGWDVAGRAARPAEHKRGALRYWQEGTDFPWARTNIYTQKITSILELSKKLRTEKVLAFDGRLVLPYDGAVTKLRVIPTRSTPVVPAFGTVAGAPADTIFLAVKTNTGQLVNGTRFDKIIDAKYYVGGVAGGLQCISTSQRPRRPGLVQFAPSAPGHASGQFEYLDLNGLEIQHLDRFSVILGGVVISSEDVWSDADIFTLLASSRRIYVTGDTNSTSLITNSTSLTTNSTSLTTNSTILTTNSTVLTTNSSSLTTRIQVFIDGSTLERRCGSAAPVAGWYVPSVPVTAQAPSGLAVPEAAAKRLRITDAAGPRPPLTLTNEDVASDIQRYLHANSNTLL